jgi:uncharacterized protein
MDAPMIATVGGALVAGLSGSPHCAMMCGPLACAGLPKERGARLKAAFGWHGGRVAAYGAVGAALGGLGAGVSHLISASAQAAVPWLMAAGLIATAFDAGRWLKPVPGVGSIARWLARRAVEVPPTLRAGLMGAATPFLPCGLLYGVFLAVLATGSAAWGSVLLASFAALAAMQLPALATAKLNPWVRRGVLLLAATVLIWRAAHAPGPDVAPQCH